MLAKLGTDETLSIAQGAVGIVENDFYLANTSEEVRDRLAAEILKVKNGEVEVIDCLKWSDEEYETLWPALRDGNRLN